MSDEGSQEEELWQAVIQNDEDGVGRLLQQQRASPNFVSRYENWMQPITPLIVACLEDYMSVVKLLLQYGADVHATGGGKQTALHLAAGKGHDEIVALLLENDAIVDAVDKNGWTPLHWAAAFSKHGSVVEILMNHKANPDIKNKTGQYPHDYLFGEIRGHVRAYWKAHRLAPLLLTGRVRPDTVKVYLVGSSRAGKTTFSRAVTGQGDPFNVLERTAGIDILEVEIDSFGRLKFYDFAGHEFYHTTHSFFFGGASALFAYLVNTLLSSAEMEEDATLWLATIYSGRAAGDPPPHLMMLGSRGEEEQEVRQINMECAMENVMKKFKDCFIFHGEPKVLDVRQKDSNEMKMVKEQLVAGAQRCLEFVPDVPLVCHEIRQNVLPQLRQERRAQAATSSREACGQVIEMSELHTRVQKESGALKEKMMYDLLLEHLAESGEIVDAGDRCVIDTQWLCHSIVGAVMSSKADKESKEFKIRMNARTDGTATLEDIRNVLDRFGRLYKTQAVSPMAATQILCHMGISLPFPDNRFLFPVLIQEGKPDTAWLQTEGMLYVGIRLKTPSDIAIFSPSAFSLLQSKLANQQSELLVRLWNGGMEVKKVSQEGQPKVEALIVIHKTAKVVQAIDIISRGPAYCRYEVKQFLNKLQHEAMRMLDVQSPGTVVDRHYLSHKHITQHVSESFSYSQDEVDTAMQGNGMLTKVTATETVQDSVIDILAVKEDHLIFKLQALSKCCSSHWLGLGCILLSCSEDDVCDMTVSLGDEAKMTDKFCCVAETWIRRQWKTASVDEFLEACDCMGAGIRQRVEEELGMPVSLSQGICIEGCSTELTATEVLAAVVENGVHEWYRLSTGLGFNAAKVEDLTDGIVSHSGKLQRVFDQKCALTGPQQAVDELLKACKTVEIMGGVMDALGMDIDIEETDDFLAVKSSHDIKQTEAQSLEQRKVNKDNKEKTETLECPPGYSHTEEQSEKQQKIQQHTNEKDICVVQREDAETLECPPGYRPTEEQSEKQQTIQQHTNEEDICVVQQEKAETLECPPGYRLTEEQSEKQQTIQQHTNEEGDALSPSFGEELILTKEVYSVHWMTVIIGCICTLAAVLLAVWWR